MAYESRDVRAHNEAQKAGIRTTGMDIVDPSHVLSTLLCPRTPDTDEPAKLLAQAIEASDRFTANTTVCLEVEGPLPIPSYVKDALENLNGYPVKLIVVCDGATTHAPGPLLDPDFCQKVKDTSPGGTLWHPIAKQPVWG
ncbi:hypothetical protein [Pseudomonas sp. S1(2024)]|uniref:hypothetical protein n=1 Tax=Pseudomonas sp. S1(2024) TaxID=3390191 RepID=UPI003978EF54